MLGNSVFFLFLIPIQLSNCATRRPLPPIRLLAKYHPKVGEFRVYLGNSSANSSAHEFDRASTSSASEVNLACFTSTPPSENCLRHVSQMRNLSLNDTLALAARVRALIADRALHFDSELFDKEALALACLAHDGGGWMPYEGDCSKCRGDCEQIYIYHTQEICEALFCPSEATTEAIFTTTVLNNFSVHVTTQNGNGKSSQVTIVTGIIIVIVSIFVIFGLAIVLLCFLTYFCCECGKWFL